MSNYFKHDQHVPENSICMTLYHAKYFNIILNILV